MFWQLLWLLQITLQLSEAVPLLQPQTNDSNNAASLDGLLSNLPNNGDLFEGDIVMDNRVRRAVWGEKSKKSTIADEGMFGSGFKWPSAVIYYEIEKSFIARGRELLAEAMAEFQQRTCVKFQSRKLEKDYVVFSSRKQCSSHVGMMGGPQYIYLGRNCLTLGTFQHEIMHALGIIHEHSRADRDEYIKIFFENIKANDIRNFNKYQLYEVENLKEEFNFASIMLYRNDAFTKNLKNTIEAINEPDLKFGQRKQFSIGDVKQINYLYGCRKYLREPNYDGLIKNYHGVANRKPIKKRFLERFMSTMDRVLGGWNVFNMFSNDRLI